MTFDFTNKDTKEIAEELENGIKEVYTSGRYQDYLDCYSNFHNYSFNNVFMILSQNPDATQVASFNTWKKLNRNVKKGEVGIRILAPITRASVKVQEKIDPETKEPILNEDGSPVLEAAQQKIVGFKAVPVFDISQTEGEPLPTLTKQLEGELEDFNILFENLKAIAPVPVYMENINNGALGYYSRAKGCIAIKNGMSDLQTIKTTIHEIAHSMLHDEDTEQSRGAKEVEAESIAYIVSKKLGIDTSDYSFGYVAAWSSDKEMTSLKESLDLIKQTSDDILKKLQEKYKDKNIDKSLTEQIKDIVPKEEKPEKQKKTTYNKKRGGR